MRYHFTFTIKATISGQQHQQRTNVEPLRFACIACVNEQWYFKFGGLFTIYHTDENMCPLICQCHSYKRVKDLPQKINLQTSIQRNFININKYTQIGNTLKFFKGQNHVKMRKVVRIVAIFGIGKALMGSAWENLWDIRNKP